MKCFFRRNRLKKDLVSVLTEKKSRDTELGFPAPCPLTFLEEIEIFREDGFLRVG